MSEPSTPPSAPPPSADGGNRAMMIVLSYLWILALVPFLVEKRDKEVQWHAKHGLVLFAAELILWVAIAIVQVAVPFGCVLTPIVMLLWLAVLVLHIVCIVKGVNGQRLIIPGVSQYADKF